MYVKLDFDTILHACDVLLEKEKVLRQTDRFRVREIQKICVVARKAYATFGSLSEQDFNLLFMKYEGVEVNE